MAIVIGNSVGAGGVNQAQDVRNVQILLNCSHLLLAMPATKVIVDGLNGPQTEAAIRAFQTNILHGTVDGRVNPGGATINKLNAVAPTLELKILQAGDTQKKEPYTIAIIANPALETATQSGVYIADPILASKLQFDAAADYTFRVLFGQLPGQQEKLLDDPAIRPKIRVVSLYLDGLPAVDSNALVSHYAGNITEPRRDRFAPFLASFGIQADVAYAITNSATHNRASAWYTTDDPTRGTVSYQLDGITLSTSKFCKIPGTVAQHIISSSLTGLHEFGHAFSSFTEGQITDQYVDSAPALNIKHGRPIPAAFGNFQGVAYNTDAVRDHIGYPSGWASFHPELTDLAVPSLMDNYWLAPAPRTPLDCRFDKLTAAFIRHRLAAKFSRP